jgi:zinc transport system substrate-binding protein
MRTNYIIFGLAAIILVGAGCAATQNKPTPDTTQTQRPTVVASFFPIAEVSHAVVGDLADVVVITPEGTEPHDYEPTPKQIQEILSADVFFMNGAGLDPWGEKLHTDLETKQVAVLELTDGIVLKEGGAHEHHEDAVAHAETGEHHGEDEHTAEAHVDEAGHAHEDDAGKDPHVWLDPTVMMHAAATLRDKMMSIDPNNATQYAQQTQVFLSALESLDAAYKTGLSTCEKNSIIVSHDAFAYLSDRYGFTTHAIAGLSPSAEPSAKQLAELAEEAKENKTEYIFFESLVSPKLAQTLAAEVGAKTLVLTPIEGRNEEEAGANATYISLMQKNLENLKTALACK